MNLKCGAAYIIIIVALSLVHRTRKEKCPDAPGIIFGPKKLGRGYNCLSVSYISFSKRGTANV